jgi:hypothetical protein
MNNNCKGCWLRIESCLIHYNKMDNICPCALCIVKPMCRIILMCDRRDAVLEILKDKLEESHPLPSSRAMCSI